jgi:hypothetical protein
MNHINLIERSTTIENELFKELYLSNLLSLKRHLSFFDRKGVDATVTFHAFEQDHKLAIGVEVECEDEVFKKVIESNLKAFNKVFVPAAK